MSPQIVAKGRIYRCMSHGTSACLAQSADVSGRQSYRSMASAILPKPLESLRCQRGANVAMFRILTSAQLSTMSEASPMITVDNPSVENTAPRFEEVGSGFYKGSKDSKPSLQPLVLN